MKVIDANLEHLVEDVFLSKYGTYYLCNTFIITEIDQGVVFDIEAYRELQTLLTTYYPDKDSVSLVSNRINQYAVVPTDWLKVFGTDDTKIDKLAVIGYDRRAFLNAELEKQIFNAELKSFNFITDAIDWVTKH